MIFPSLKTEMLTREPRDQLVQDRCEADCFCIAENLAQASLSMQQVENLLPQKFYYNYFAGLLKLNLKCAKK